jgi:hypothetical protein
MIQLQLVQPLHIIHQLRLSHLHLLRHLSNIRVCDLRHIQILRRVEVRQIASSDLVQILQNSDAFHFELLLLDGELRNFLPLFFL